LTGASIALDVSPNRLLLPGAGGAHQLAVEVHLELSAPESPQLVSAPSCR
jgi:hypothetical protein